jgi:ATP-binding protein involved in chromosome partitioning
VQSRASEIVVNGSNLGFSLDISGIELAEAESVRKQLIKKIQETTNFEKINIVLTSTRKNQNTPTEKPKIHIEGVGKILLIASGKGGVGKSTIAALLAHKLKNGGKKVGIVDADIYGPSIPHLFSLKGKPALEDNKMVPLENYGIVVNSIGFLTEPSASISWRGPMASKAIYQLLSLTKWGNLDYLIIDSPPGTGDIHLSILQNYIIDQVIMVTTPQKISGNDVSRAISLYKKFHVPIWGVIENMSYYTIPQTSEKIEIFTGDGGIKIAFEHKLELLTKLPIDSRLSIACDAGGDLSEFSYLLDATKLP